ncbi:MAG: exosortase/archaeosortase family protein [Candidatus Brocadiales bacterium]|nr:exosortase/archaeosortase family protein [Candidatus Brocadiales bacterium]
MINYLIWVLAAIVYTPVFINLYQVRWDKLDYTHAYFILPIFFGLLWWKRNDIKKIVQTPGQKTGSPVSLLLLTIGIIIFIFGHRQNYIFLQTLSLIPFLFGLTGYMHGTKLSKELAFPILYLLLLVPPPFGILDSITLPMRYGSAAATEYLLNLTGYPITRDGLDMVIGYNTIYMGAPCSGFRSLITMISLFLAYVYVIQGAIPKKVLLILFITPLALFGNLVRVITLCLITFYHGEEVGQGFFHNFSGIVIFIITLSGLMSIETLLNKIWPDKSPQEQTT